MTFAQPLWLLVALVVLAAGVGLIVFSERKRRQKLHRLVAARLLPALAPANDRRRFTGHVLWLGALLCLLVALARPQGGLLETTARVQGANLLISVDVSRSMLADDLPPNRLFRAKLALQDFAENRPGDRLGLLAFAGSAFLQVPPTLDRNAFSDTLMALEPGVVAGRGTNLAAAIREATKAVPDDTRSSAIILLSDGGNLSGDTLAAAGAAADAGITVFTVGVGTPEGTLLRDANGTRILGPGGEPVVTKLEPETLIAVAEMTGGVYVPLGATGSGLAEIGSRLEALAETVAESRVHQSREEFFQYPLATAALLLLVEAWLLPLRRKRLPVPGSASATVACLLLTALALPGSEALAQAPDEAAARQADDPQVPSAQTQPERPPPEVQKALEPYVRRLARDPTDARAHFNVGTILMEAGFAAEARGYLEKAVTFGNPETQARAYFNLGHLAARHAWPLHEAMPEWASLSETFDPQLDAIARQTDAAKRLGEEVYAAATDFATPAMLRRADVPDESTIRSVLQGVENAAQQLGQIREMAAAELQAARELEEAWSTVDAYFEAAGYLDEELELPAEDSVRWIQERRKEFPTGETIQKLETVTSTAADLSRETDAPPIARLHVEMEDLAERLRELLPDPPQPESK
ncbi:MAG: VWA domain-containing protein [Opitutales bacterium]